MIVRGYVCGEKSEGKECRTQLPCQYAYILTVKLAAVTVSHRSCHWALSDTTGPNEKT